MSSSSSSQSLFIACFVDNYRIQNQGLLGLLQTKDEAQQDCFAKVKRSRFVGISTSALFDYIAFCGLQDDMLSFPAPQLKQIPSTQCTKRVEEEIRQFATPSTVPWDLV